MFKKIKSSRSFTLLEVLIVIGILAILIAFSAVSYAKVQSVSRDAKRKTDLETIQNALEQYYSSCGYIYPTPETGNKITSIICSSPSQTFLNPVPLDPKDGTSYSYTDGGPSYTLSATLEKDGSSLSVTNKQ